MRKRSRLCPPHSNVQTQARKQPRDAGSGAACVAGRPHPFPFLSGWREAGSGGEEAALTPALAVGWLARAPWAITSPPEREGGILPLHSAGSKP